MSNVDIDPLNLWSRAKHLIQELDIQESQVNLWFQRNYHLEISLMDFDLLSPPTRLTIAQLAHFCHSVERYVNNH